MRIYLSEQTKKKLFEVIQKAGNKETGGILMGEYITDDTYKIVDFTIQKTSGTVFSFQRLLDGFVDPLKHFFKKTNFNYRKYNYLGEWHTHPNFSVQPSSTDIESMFEIVEDSLTNANFAVLLIIRINSDNQLECSANVFYLGGMISAEILIDDIYE